MSQFLSEKPSKTFLNPEVFEVLVYYSESCDEIIRMFEEILNDLDPNCFMRKLNWYKSVVEKETMLNGVIDYRMGFECCYGNVCVFHYKRRERYCRVFEEPFGRDEIMEWFKSIEEGSAQKLEISEEPYVNNEQMIVFKNFKEKISIPDKDVFVILTQG